MLRNEGVQVHQRADPRSHPIGDRRYHHASIRVATKDHVGQFLRLDDPTDITNVGLERDVSTVEVRAFSQTREGWGKYRVSVGTKFAGNVTITPTPMPRS